MLNPRFYGGGFLLNNLRRQKMKKEVVIPPFLFLPCFNGNPFNKKGDPLAAFSKIQKISFNTF